MWSNLPSDLLANIFSFLAPDSLARARSACRHWHACAKTNYSLLSGASSLQHQGHQDWFLALPTRNRSQCCYVHNPVMDNWHLLSLDFLPGVPVRPIASIGSLILIRSASSTSLQLALCNPFTRQFRRLPMLHIARTNPALGVVQLDSSSSFPCFRVYVAGGMSEARGGGGATYEPTLEMFDSMNQTWEIVGSMPMEFAVRLTVWTPNESVYSGGVLYWMTSARAYSVMGLEIGSRTWRELSVPMADRLEFAALVRRRGRVALVGGTCGYGGCVWELKEGDFWVLIENVPLEMGMRLFGRNGTKCVGGERAICLYREIGSGMIVWREVEGDDRWEWVWVEGCCFIRGKKVPNLPIKGVFLQPNLASSCMF